MNISDKGKRLGTYIVDLIATGILLLPIASIYPEYYQKNGTILFFVLYASYCFLFEVFSNKTIGKFFSNTIVVDLNGDKPSIFRLFIRNTIRLIPIDAFTFLMGTGHGLHDLVSKTKVIDFKTDINTDISNQPSEELKVLLSKQKTIYLKWIVFSCVLNILLFYVVYFKAFTSEFVIYSIEYIFTVFIVGFSLGFILSFFPYKNLPYSNKYLRSSLLAILSLNILCISIGIFQGVQVIFNIYS